MSNEEYTKLNARLDRIERLTIVGAKKVLNLDEAVMLTGMSKGYIYRLTSMQQIPHFKKGRKLYFKKSELEEWLLDCKVMTANETANFADTYIATHKR